MKTRPIPDKINRRIFFSGVRSSRRTTTIGLVGVLKRQLD